MKTMTKRVGVFCLYVNDFAPDILKITKPFLENWCKRIGADLHYITERKYPDMPPNYEKFQIYELGKEYDYQIFIDADALVPLEMFDPTEFIGMDEICFNRVDPANSRFKFDKYFRRDGRNIGAGTFFVVTTKWTLDAWKPLELQDDITKEDCIANITPIRVERNFGVDAVHLLDDYLVSRNIAKYGLKVRTLVGDVCDKIKCKQTLQHAYLDTKENKAKYLSMVVEDLNKASGSFFKPIEEKKDE